MSLRSLWVATRTRNVADAGTSDKPRLVFEPPGGPLFFPELSFNGDHLRRGRGGLAVVDLSNSEVLPDDISPTLVAGGDDWWALEQAAVWGVRAEDGAVVPIGFGAAPPQGLSLDSSEGLTAFTIPPAIPGSANMVIRRLLIVIHTGPAIGLPIPAAGGTIGEMKTDSPVNLQIGTASGLVVDYDFPETPQADLDTFQANYYIANVASPFRRRDLTDDESIVLSIKGADRWVPSAVSIFGIESTRLNTLGMVPLVHLAPYPFQALSTDPEEGVDSVRLPLAPMDDIRDPVPGQVEIDLADLNRRLAALERGNGSPDHDVRLPPGVAELMRANGVGQATDSVPAD
jgi:hypothetical protein